MARFVKNIWDNRLLQSRDASSHLGQNLSASSHLGMNLDLPLIWVYRFVHFAFGYHVAFGYMVRLGTHDFPPRPLFAHTRSRGLGMCFAHGPKGNLSYEGYTHLSNSGRASHFEHTQQKVFGHIAIHPQGWTNLISNWDPPLPMPNAYVRIDISADLHMANRRDGTKRRF